MSVEGDRVSQQCHVLHRQAELLAEEGVHDVTQRVLEEASTFIASLWQERERYRQGMDNWKRTAEEKDVQMVAARSENAPAQGDAKTATPRTDEMLSMMDAGGIETVNGALVLYRAINLCRELERDLAELGRRYDRIVENQRVENYEELLDSRDKWAESARSQYTCSCPETTGGPFGSPGPLCRMPSSPPRGCRKRAEDEARLGTRSSIAQTIDANWPKEELEGAPRTRECLAGGTKTIGQVRADLETLCVTLERELAEARRTASSNGRSDLHNEIQLHYSEILEAVREIGKRGYWCGGMPVEFRIPRGETKPLIERLFDAVYGAEETFKKLGCIQSATKES